METWRVFHVAGRKQSLFTWISGFREVKANELYNQSRRKLAIESYERGHIKHIQQSVQSCYFLCLMLPHDNMLPWCRSLREPKYNISHKSNAIPVTVRGDQQGRETLKLPHFLDNRLIDDGEVVSLTRRPPFTRRRISGFLLEAEWNPGS
jgi:hypothetical protein